MDLPKSFYLSPTAEQIEEYIEFIDWSLMPINRIPKETKEKFSWLNSLGMIIWLQDILSSCDVLENKTEFPNRVFFFRNDKLYAEFTKIEGKGKVCFDYDETFEVIAGRFGLEINSDTLTLMRNVLKYQLGFNILDIEVLLRQRTREVEKFFAQPSKPVMRTPGRW